MQKLSAKLLKRPAFETIQSEARRVTDLIYQDLTEGQIQKIMYPGATVLAANDERIARVVGHDNSKNEICINVHVYDGPYREALTDWLVAHHFRLSFRDPLHHEEVERWEGQPPPQPEKSAAKKVQWEIPIPTRHQFHFNLLVNELGLTPKDIVSLGYMRIASIGDSLLFETDLVRGYYALPIKTQPGTEDLREIVLDWLTVNHYTERRRSREEIFFSQEDY
jgi:hypothetical protein